MLKILKDPLRRRIIKLLAEEGPLEYTELLRRLGIKSTGHLNYHLKILREFLVKDELGRYMLNSDGLYLYEFLKRFGRVDVESEYYSQSFKGRLFFTGIFIVIASGMLFILSMPNYDVLARVALALYVTGYLVAGSSASFLRDSFSALGNNCSRLRNVSYSLAAYILILAIPGIFSIATNYAYTYYNPLIIATLILLPALILYVTTISKCSTNIVSIIGDWSVYAISALIITIPLIIITAFASHEKWDYIIHDLVIGSSYIALVLLGSLAYTIVVYSLDKILSKTK